MEKFLKVLDSISKFEEKIGIRKLIAYILIVLLIYGIFNFKSIVKNCIEIQEEIHNEKMEQREELTDNLSRVLRDTRIATAADRILYFEYHNSKENPVGIPFKFFDLVLIDTKDNLYPVDQNEYKDICIGTSFLLNLQEQIKSGNFLYSKDLDPQISNGFKYQDGSEYQLIFGVNINGISESGKEINQTVGFVVLEWLGIPRDDKETIISILEEISVIEKTKNFIKQSSKIK